MNLAELLRFQHSWTNAAGTGKNLFRLVLLAAILVIVASAQTAPTKPQTGNDGAGFKEFSSRVQDYVKLHKQLEGTLPRLKQTDQAELITAHQQALAKKIREARPDAKPGNIFTSQAKAAFTHAIEQEFKSDDADNARATIQQGAPVKEVQLKVNQVYPDDLPHTSVPPTLLLKFPRLPDELAYRLVDKDLVLIDAKANLVVDLLPKAMP